MEKKYFVTCQMLNAYLEEHADHDIGNVFSDAAKYFEKTGALCEYAAPFSMEAAVRK